MTMDRRQIAFEIKTLRDSDGVRAFEGYGSVFGTLDSYNDTVKKGAFKATLKEWKTKGKLPKMLLQHGGGGLFSRNAVDMVPIGKWDDMREDDHGLYVKGHLFDVDTDRTRLTYAAMKEGELDGLSIGFFVRKYARDEQTDVRTLTEIDLLEVSIVTFPANEPATITDVRATDMTEREFERFLRRDVGFTEKEAKTIIAKGYRQVRRDAKPSDEVEELLALVTRRGAIWTGDQRHGTDAAGSQGCDRDV
jgi:Escherichia/Staphylococcus phage prohead protease